MRFSLCDIFGADINKRNFKSFLEKQNNINIGDYDFNKETANKLRKRGLSDDKIAEILSLRIDEIHEI